MLVAVGIPFYEGKCLLSQRAGNWPETDFFEFPSAVLEEFDTEFTLEDALE